MAGNRAVRPRGPRVRWLSHAAGILLAAGGLAAGGFALADRLFPPDLSRAGDLSIRVVDREGRPLRTYLTADGMTRLRTAREDVDPRYVKMLLAFEDKRFLDHAGVDILALGRAIGQAVAAGRFVSGASTLTLQTARLLEQRPRGMVAKFMEMFRALQLERRHSKDEILGMYFTLAPFGGNLEGVRAAAWAYFGREPKALTAGEAALLVALPRAPGRLRPERFAAAAGRARDQVLTRVGTRSGYRADEVGLAMSEAVTPRRRLPAFLAPHLADRLRAGREAGAVVRSSIDALLQHRVRALARDWVGRIGDTANVAVLVVENAGRAVRTHVGSADFRDSNRDGQVDFSRAVRSPGSTLKPAIYGLAFDRGLAHPATIVDDAPTQFGDYAPAIFMDRHHGKISLAEALRLSLNVPAVALLDQLGPVAFVERLGRAGVPLSLGTADARPGLAVALGGVGITLEDLVGIYLALGDDGRVKPLRFLAQGGSVPETEPLFRPLARWQVARILEGVVTPVAARGTGRVIAHKTGTSYGFRDAWAVGFSATHTVGVWVGRPDGAPLPGRFGANTAAPLMHRVFDLLPKAPAPSGKPPAGAGLLAAGGLPPALRRLGARRIARLRAGPPPRIVHPPDEVVLRPGAQSRGIALEAEGGRRPLVWLVDGKPLSTARWTRRAAWRADGPGFSELVVIDALGRRARARVRILAAPEAAPTSRPRG